SPKLCYEGPLGEISQNCRSTRSWHTGTLGETMAIWQLAQWFRRSSSLLFFVLSAALFLFAHECTCFVPQSKYRKIKDLHHKTQVQQFKKDVSNSATQDSIMNAHKKTQLTHARINCALKNSSCDSPLSKILKFTILASNASSRSTMVLKCPHTKNDSIFTHNDSQFKALESNATLTLTNMNTIHDFTLRYAIIFQSTIVSAHSRSK
ncbi:hypothetical protein H5410_058814, partial [Solanum commersonii]